MLRVKGILWAALSSSTFGLAPLFTLLLLGVGYSSFEVLTYRWGVASLCLGAYGLLAGCDFRLGRRELGTVFLLSLFRAATSLSLVIAYQNIASGVASTIHFMYPLVVAVVMMCFFRERGSVWTFAAIGMSIVGAVLLSLGMTLVLFMLLPTFVAGLFRAQNAALHNLIEGVIKVAIFLAYLILCSKQKDVRRVFCYHGAEHKTIFCYEAGLPLTVENARIQPKHHPRCGTSFLFVVIIVSILCSSVVFSYVNWQNIWVRIGMHLLLLIPVVGITYEFNRLVGRHDNVLTRVLSAPGMWLQNFTVNEPDDSMLEVAIEALKLVLPEEKGKDRW